MHPRDETPISAPTLRRTTAASSALNPAPTAPDAAARLSLLYDVHNSACYALARHILRDVHLAEDVIQEVFCAVWSGAATYDPSRGTTRTWLLGLTHHKAVDAVRRHQRHAGRAAAVAALDTVAAETDVEQDAWRAVRGGHVLAALSTLSEVQREVLVLAYFGAYTQIEIAELTGIPLGTVKTRTLTALRRLRGHLDLVALEGAEP
jgi:RNA polymerase sigma factor (sigma-70 family)